MLTTAEKQKAVRGIFGILKGDDKALAYFGNSPEECLKSFWSLVLLLPTTIISAYATYTSYQMPVTKIEYIYIMSMFFCIQAAIWPLIIFKASIALNARNRIYNYISAHNWFSGFIGVFELCIQSIQFIAGEASNTFVAIILIISSIYFMYCLGYVLYKSLRIKISQSIMLLVFYMLTLFVIGNFKLQMIGIDLMNQIEKS